MQLCRRCNRIDWVLRVRGYCWCGLSYHAWRRTSRLAFSIFLARLVVQIEEPHPSARRSRRRCYPKLWLASTGKFALEKFHAQIILTEQYCSPAPSTLGAKTVLYALGGSHPMTRLKFGVGKKKRTRSRQTRRGRRLMGRRGSSRIEL